MAHWYSTIVQVEWVRHHKRHKGVRIVPIRGPFPDAKSARAHLHVRHGHVLLVGPSGDAHRIVSESNHVLLPTDADA